MAGDFQALSKTLCNVALEGYLERESCHDNLVHYFNQNYLDFKQKKMKNKLQADNLSDTYSDIARVLNLFSLTE